MTTEKFERNASLEAWSKAKHEENSTHRKGFRVAIAVSYLFDFAGWPIKYIAGLKSMGSPVERRAKWNLISLATLKSR